MKSAFLLLALLFPSIAVAQMQLDLVLPTANRALFRNDGPAFYQYTDRTFRGEKSTPWQGGKYGFSRTPIETSAGVINRQFHEGIDIKPVNRDASGEPRDIVVSIASGTVVHASHVASYSNYGKYVVVEHVWGGSPYYSLYAHLKAIDVKVGDKVGKGARLGLMGYTGAGIDRRRAHVHLELGLLLNRKFEDWYSRYVPKDPNRHGRYNGMNLAGIDVAKLYQLLRQRPDLTIPQFFKMEKPVFKVAVPRQSIDLLKRYPWLYRGDYPAAGLAWEIAFSGSGLPLQISSYPERISEPRLTWMKPSPYPNSALTRGYVASGSKPKLTASGRRYLDLILTE